MSAAPRAYLQAGGTGATIAGIILAVQAATPYTPPGWELYVLPVALTLAMTYLVPPSLKDKIDMVTAEVIQAAAAVGKLPPPVPAGTLPVGTPVIPAAPVAAAPVPGAGGPVHNG